MTEHLYKLSILFKKMFVEQPRTPLESLDYPAARWQCTSRLSNYGEVNAGRETDRYKFLWNSPGYTGTGSVKKVKSP